MRGQGIGRMICVDMKAPVMKTGGRERDGDSGTKFPKKKGLVAYGVYRCPKRKEVM